MSHTCTFTLEPLARLLRFWEDMMWLRGMQDSCRRNGQHPFFPEGIYSDTQFHGPLTQWRHFREALTHIHQTGFDWVRFVGDTEIQDIKGMSEAETDPEAKQMAQGFEMLGIGMANNEFPVFRIPACIASWTEKSRRCFKVSEEMQLLLAATPLDGIPWDAVRFPFDSFMIRLALPIPFGKNHVNAILISRESEYRPDEFMALTGIDCPIAVTLITDNIGAHPIDLQFKQRITRKAKSDPMLVVMQLAPVWFKSCGLDQAIQGFNPIPTTYFHPEIIKTGEAKVLDKVQGTHTENIVYRIIFGLILYLNTREGSKEGEVWADPMEKVPGMHRIITDGAQVCDLGHRYRINDEERRTFLDCMEGHGGWEVASHARRGHFRRPPNSQFDAKQTVWVRPCIVREDRLVHEKGVMLGTEQVLDGKIRTSSSRLPIGNAT